MSAKCEVIILRDSTSITASVSERPELVRSPPDPDRNGKKLALSRQPQNYIVARSRLTCGRSRDPDSD